MSKAPRQFYRNNERSVPNQCLYGKMKILVNFKLVTLNHFHLSSVHPSRITCGCLNNSPYNRIMGTNTLLKYLLLVSPDLLNSNCIT